MIRIDINQQVNLSDDGCDIAIAIWNRLGVFATTSDIAGERFKEVNIWEETFSNYSLI